MKGTWNQTNNKDMSVWCYILNYVLWFGGVMFLCGNCLGVV